MRNAVGRTIVAALALVLAACVPAPSSGPAPMTEPAAATFIVPKPTDEPAARTALTDASFSRPDVERELKSYFELFYKARTLPRGGQFDPSALRALVEGPYADYTMPLFDRDIGDATSGGLLDVSAIGHEARLQLSHATHSADAQRPRTH